MSLIKSALVAASFAFAGAVSANATTPYDSSRVEAMRFHETTVPVTMSAQARQARAQAVTPIRQAAPFSRMSLEYLTQ
jgi:hypothetical protein